MTENKEHIHKWKEQERYADMKHYFNTKKRVYESEKRIGTTIVLRCETCGDLKVVKTHE